MDGVSSMPDPSLWSTVNHYEKSAAQITTFKQRQTLRRHPLLLFILTICPVLTTFAVACNFFYRSMPVGDGFGVISLLAAVQPEALMLLQGAELSGKLSRKVYVDFHNEPAAHRAQYTKIDGHVRIVVGERGKPARLSLGQIYG